MKKLKRWFPWIMGGLVALALLLWVQTYFFIRYETSDDTLILKATMGYEGGAPATFFLCVSSLLLTPLSWLTRAFASLRIVPWYLLLQLFFLLFSIAVVVKSILQIGAQRGNPLWQGLVIAVACAASIGIYAIARPQFATTCAVLAAGAVCQMMAQARSERRLFPGALLSGLMMTAAYMNRDDTLLSLLPVWLLALAYVLYVRYKGRRLNRACVAGVLAGVCCLGLAVGVRAAERNDPAYREFFAFHDARAKLLDYQYELPSEDLEKADLTFEDVDMIRQWYFMDETITAEKMEKLLSLAKKPQLPLTQRLPGLLPSVYNTLRDNPRQFYTAALLVCLWLVCLLSLKRKNGLGDFAWGTLALLCALAELGYLCLLGRAPTRAINCALFPALALVACMAAGVGDGLAAQGRVNRKLLCLAPAAGLCALLLTQVVTVAFSNLVLVSLAGWVVLAAFARLPQGGFVIQKVKTLPVLLALLLCSLGICNEAFIASQSALRDPPEIMADNVLESDLEAYALENPDMLLVRNPILFRDSRFLPNASPGIPPNTMNWGEWSCRTPTWYAQLSRYGFPGRSFQATDFLSDTILFADTAEEPPDYFLRYLSAHAGRPVGYELYGTYGQLRFFRFR